MSTHVKMSRIRLHALTISTTSQKQMLVKISAKMWNVLVCVTPKEWSSNWDFSLPRGGDKRVCSLAEDKLLRAVLMLTGVSVSEGFHLRVERESKSSHGLKLERFEGSSKI